METSKNLPHGDLAMSFLHTALSSFAIHTVLLRLSALSEKKYIYAISLVFRFLEDP